MRKDADLKHLFTGPRTGKPGRPRVYAGKASMHDFSRWDALPWADECMVYTVVARSVRLKRQVRVVAVVWPGSRRTEVLFSTSTEMTAATIIALYRARFSMEFQLQDGKRASVASGAVLPKKEFAWLSERQFPAGGSAALPLEHGVDGGFGRSVQPAAGSAGRSAGL
ncbi:hypothetical protein Q0M94_22550 (plasmid) [Deinococcus radiomollis]|uniref:hypothetical protein n=1 Tax=Deinococcus radiomollis TaxID=468916 RepID=UPI0038926553